MKNDNVKSWLQDNYYDEGALETDIMPTIAKFIEGLGVDYFAFVQLKSAEKEPDSSVNTLYSSYPPMWIETYLHRHYLEVDPVIELGTASNQPFYWNQGRFLRQFSKPQRDMFNAARGFGITCGLAVPIHGPGGQFSLLTLAAKDKKTLMNATSSSHAEILAIAYATHDLINILQRKNTKDTELEPTLTMRERECLAWTLEGKTAKEIALELNLSPATVNHYASTATKSMGSSNKYHAAIKALNMGMIQAYNVA